MADWNEIVTGRSLMARARSLILAMNALRRREEEMERRLGVMPDREVGLILDLEGKGKGFQGGEMLAFLWEGVGNSWHLHK